MVFGTSCTTFDCELQGQKVVSRIVTTFPLSLSRYSYTHEEMRNTSVTNTISSSHRQPTFEFTANVSSSHVNKVASTQSELMIQITNLWHSSFPISGLMKPTKSLTPTQTVLRTDHDLYSTSISNQNASITYNFSTVTSLGLVQSVYSLVITPSSVSTSTSQLSFSPKTSQTTSAQKATTPVMDKQSEPLLTQPTPTALDSTNNQTPTQASSAPMQFTSTTILLSDSSLHSQSIPSTKQPTASEIYEAMALEELAAATRNVKSIVSLFVS